MTDNYAPHADLFFSLSKEEMFTSQKTHNVVSGFGMRLVQLRIWIHVMSVILQQTKSLTSFLQIWKKVIAIRKENMGNIKLRKYAKHQNQYYWSMYAPPWPSSRLDRLIKNEANAMLKVVDNPLHFIFLSMTKKCPLNCKHCFEWDIMHEQEKLSLTHLKSIVNQFEEKGISSVFLTGGEPLSRYNDLLELVRHASKKCQVWIFTSAFGLTEKRSVELKKAGLIGALVSIDHFDESHHNKFRGHQTSFSKAVDGVKNAQKAGLLTALSVCTTREFVSNKNLKAYMDFAKGLGVAFVQFFEPRLEGKFEKNGELLSAKQVQLVEEFFLTFNDDPTNVDYPTIIYQGYHQRRKGCHGAGKRYLYIDSNGSINACPFCPNKIGNTKNGVVSYTTGACKSFVLNAS